MFKTNRISFQVVCKLLSFSMKPTTLRKTQGSFTHLSSMTWWVWKMGVDEEWEWKTSNWPWWDMWRRVIRYNHQTVNFVYSLSKTLKFSSSYFVREKVNHILINLLKVFFFKKYRFAQSSFIHVVNEILVILYNECGFTGSL